MPTPEKERLVEELSRKLSENEVTILADYTGINVQAVTELRDEFRKASIEYRIYKNTLARLAAEKSGLEDLKQYMEGPTGYVFADVPVIPAKILMDFIKSNPTMRIKCGLLSGKIFDEPQMKEIASLPPKEVLVARVLGQLLAPLSGLVTVLNGPIRNLVYALDDMRRKKEAAQS
jgi:large subunit ribosomal protein L10